MILDNYKRYFSIIYMKLIFVPNRDLGCCLSMKVFFKSHTNYGSHGHVMQNQRVGVFTTGESLSNVFKLSYHAKISLK